MFVLTGQRDPIRRASTHRRTRRRPSGGEDGTRPLPALRLAGDGDAGAGPGEAAELGRRGSCLAPLLTFITFDLCQRGLGHSNLAEILQGEFDIHALTEVSPVKCNPAAQGFRPIFHGVMVPRGFPAAIDLYHSFSNRMRI